jgi:parallel beta-helix repeat protein
MKNLNKHPQSVSVRSPFNPLIFTILFFSIFIGCKKDESIQPQQSIQAQSVDQSTAKWGIPNIIVHKGQSIQAAVNKAKAGWVILVQPGTYAEAVVIDKPGIKLIGNPSLSGGEVIIENPGDEEYGVSVTDQGDGVVIANITVKNFSEYGVYLDSADNYIISHVTAINNTEYGIFPSHCNHGLIEFCSATGSNDTGIYVGQSSDAEVQFNTAFGNVNGMEIENSSDIDVSFNQSYNNVAGLLVDLLPGLGRRDVLTSANIHVHSNHIYNNNHINFATDPNELESHIPVGIGILVMGTDQTLVDNNVVTGNNFSGIIVFSTTVLIALGVAQPSDFDIEPNPDGDKIANNYVKYNGAHPPVIPNLPLPGVDLLYQGTGTNNCWSNNIYTTNFTALPGNPPLPSCN